MNKITWHRRPIRAQLGLLSHCWAKWASCLLLIAAGCTQPPETAQLLPVAAGQARIWFYRDWEPSESLNLANIDVNGTYFGSVANGGVFYRHAGLRLGEGAGRKPGRHPSRAAIYPAAAG